MQRRITESKKGAITGKCGFDAGSELGTAFWSCFTPHVDVCGEVLSQVGLTRDWLVIGTGGES